MSHHFFKKFFLILTLFIISLLIFDKDYLLQLNIFQEKEKKEIEKTIEIYNKILMDFFATGGNPSLIDEMPAAKILKHEIFKEIGFLSANQRVLVWDLASFKIEDVKFYGFKKAKAMVLEEWNYQFQDLFTRKPFSDVRGRTVKVEYDLRKVKNKWMIFEWSPLN